LRFAARGAAKFAVDGTPADCVRAALHVLTPDAQWVLAGINEGGNLGTDVYLSGTVAAVREAVLHGRPGIAVSQYIKRGVPLEWRQSAGRLVRVLRELLAQPWTPRTLWNVNLPHLEPGAAAPAVVYCPLDPHPLPVAFRREGDLLHYHGDYHKRARVADSDVDVCFSGQIAVTRLALG